MKRYIIIFYTREPKPPKYFSSTRGEMAEMFRVIIELTKQKAKFAIYEVGECLGDYS